MSKVFDKNSVETPLTALLRYIKDNGKHGAYFMCVDGSQFAVVEINGSTKAFAVKQSSVGPVETIIKITSKDFSEILSENPKHPATLLYQIFEADSNNGLENGISVERIGEFFSAYQK